MGNMTESFDGRISKECPFNFESIGNFKTIIVNLFSQNTEGKCQKDGKTVGMIFS